jgi:hypothetical protein
MNTATEISISLFVLFLAAGGLAAAVVYLSAPSKHGEKHKPNES